MKRREKILAAALAIATALGVGFEKLEQALFEPITQRESKAASLERTIDDDTTRQTRLVAARQKLDGWLPRSLSVDPSAAATFYHAWLIDLAKETKLDEAIVTPDRFVAQAGAFVRIPFHIEARARFAVVGQFLAALERAQLLQKVTHLRLEALDQQADPDLRIELRIEALSLADAGHNAPQVLPADKLIAASAPQPRATLRNPFARPQPVTIVQAPVAPPVPVAPPEDRLAKIFLVASLTQNARQEAWLYDLTQKRPTVLRAAESFHADKVTGKVVAIEKDSVLLEMDGSNWRLELGKNLRQLKRVSGDVRLGAVHRNKAGSE
jgi:hypothetical protein